MPMPDPSELVHVACALCGGQEAEPWLRACNPERPDQQFTVVQCARCGLRFVNPRPADDALALYYPDDYYAYQPHEVRPRSHRLKLALWRRLGLLPVPERSGGEPPLARMARHLTRSALGVRATWTLPASHAGARFLDLGCGAGARLMLAADLGWRTFGVDRSGPAIAAVRAQGHAAVVADVASLPFATGSMDYVSLSHVLEHTHDPVKTLREVRRILRTGGVAQVLAPNVASWSAGVFGEHWAALELPRHCYHFTAQTITAVAHAAGLEVLWLRTLANRWVLETSVRAAGIGGGRARALRAAWRAHCRLGHGDDLNVWLARPEGHAT